MTITVLHHSVKKQRSAACSATGKDDDVLTKRWTPDGGNTLTKRSRRAESRQAGLSYLELDVCSFYCRSDASRLYVLSRSCSKVNLKDVT